MSTMHVRKIRFREIVKRLYCRKLRSVRIKPLYTLHRPVIRHKIPRYISRRDIIWVRSTHRAPHLDGQHCDGSGMIILARGTSWNYVLTTVSFNSIKPAIIFTTHGNNTVMKDTFLKWFVDEKEYCCPSLSPFNINIEQIERWRIFRI